METGGEMVDMEPAVAFGDDDDGDPGPAIVLRPEELRSVHPPKRPGRNHEIGRCSLDDPGPGITRIHVPLVRAAKRLPDRASNRSRAQRITRSDHNPERHGLPLSR